jgi:hypothetical protein
VRRKRRHADGLTNQGREGNARPIPRRVFGSDDLYLLGRQVSPARALRSLPLAQEAEDQLRARRTFPLSRKNASRIAARARYSDSAGTEVLQVPDYHCHAAHAAVASPPDLAIESSV